MASSRLLGFLLFSVLLFFNIWRIRAQAPAPAPAVVGTTDPVEATALNTIFNRWSLKASDGWNISGNLCSGVALLESSFENYNPIIVCNCDFDNGATCRIIRVKVYALNVAGPIPEELQNLTQLIQIRFDQNYLSGEIPSFLGNLTNMQVLTLGVNLLTGTLPKELGLLSKLTVIGIGSLNLSGSLPPEIGNLINMEYMFIDGCGLSGEIPSTFANLRRLKTFQAGGNNFTGKIPDFFGNFTELLDLSLNGNSFEGPIPSTLGNLNKIQSLRLGDIKSGSSSFSFLRSQTSLTTLVVRNARISGTLPTDFNRFRNLLHLDLSFNSITGEVPQSLFSLSSLQFLFLGNNNLSGSLPEQKSTILKNLDLSYNNLSGGFPSWISENGLKLNLVANNFSLDSSANSILGAGFRCLQQDIPCRRGSPIYSSFGIDCGSRRSITASDGIEYEIDGQDLSIAAYYVTPRQNWAVSSVGRFLSAIQPNYISNNPNQFPNTLDSELFQTARLSPSSLRYYGLGLENGNYTVTLQYAETAFPDDQTWRSLGRRMFNVYIQGVLREEDFDIRKEAGGSFLALVRKYNVTVRDNFLEVHFFWAGKGSCCLPTQGVYGPSISAVSASPNFRPTVRAPSTSRRNQTGLIVGLVVGFSAILLLAGVALLFIRARRLRAERADLEDLRAISSSAEVFSYGDLRSATNDFSAENKLGEGGFGAVFKGTLADGRVVAVKQLLVSSNQGKQQFVAEISAFSTVRHKNLVKLLGCSVEGEKRLIVYEYHENGSLDQTLFAVNSEGKRGTVLDWETRMKICMGTARGLAYLHEETNPRIVHRDVKASNILLDAELNPKISDFGLAKLFDDNKTHISTRVAGTIGYLAPEYAFRGQLTEKVDVFGFGVLALEIVCGRPNTDTSLPADKVYLLEHVWRLHENNQDLDLLDPTLASYNKEEALNLIRVSLLCTQTPFMRPSMSRIVAMLTGDVEVDASISKPSYITDWQFSGITSTFSSSAQSGLSPVADNASHITSESQFGSNRPESSLLSGGR